MIALQAIGLAALHTTVAIAHENSPADDRPAARIQGDAVAAHVLLSEDPKTH